MKCNTGFAGLCNFCDRHARKQYGNLFVFWDSRRVAEAFKELPVSRLTISFMTPTGIPYSAVIPVFFGRGHTCSVRGFGEEPTSLSISTFSGWRIYARLPAALLHQRLWRLAFLMVAVWGTALFIGWFITLALCKKNYAPISELALAFTQTQDGLSQRWNMKPWSGNFFNH
ncbi:MAG: hypothetical protein ACLSA6_18995 [Holdemania massiliensis]